MMQLLDTHALLTLTRTPRTPELAAYFCNPIESDTHPFLILSQSCRDSVTYGLQCANSVHHTLYKRGRR